MWDVAEYETNGFYVKSYIIKRDHWLFIHSGIVSCVENRPTNDSNWRSAGVRTNLRMRLVTCLVKIYRQTNFQGFTLGVTRRPYLSLISCV